MSSRAVMQQHAWQNAAVLLPDNPHFPAVRIEAFNLQVLWRQTFAADYLYLHSAFLLEL